MKFKPQAALQRLLLAGGLLLFASGFQVALADPCVESDPDYDPVLATDPAICPAPPPPNTTIEPICDPAIDPNCSSTTQPPPCDPTIDPNCPIDGDICDPNSPNYKPRAPECQVAIDPIDPAPIDGDVCDPNSPNYDPNAPECQVAIDPIDPAPIDGDICDPNSPNYKPRAPECQVAIDPIDPAPIDGDVCDPNSPNYDPNAPECQVAIDPIDPAPIDGDICDPNSPNYKPRAPECQVAIDPIDPAPIDGDVCDPNSPNHDPNAPECQVAIDPIDPAPIDGDICDPNSPNYKPRAPECQVAIDPIGPVCSATDPNCQDPLDPINPCDSANDADCADNTGVNQPPPPTSTDGCQEDPPNGVFCDPFDNQICMPPAAKNQPAPCTGFGICIEDPAKGLYCDEFAQQLCFPDAKLGITCECKENPERGLYCSPDGKPICEERPAEGIFCDDVPPSCIHDPDNGLRCDAKHKQAYDFTCIDNPEMGEFCGANGEQCITYIDRLGNERKDCATDFNMNTFDVNDYDRQELRFVDDEDDMQKLPPDFFAKLTPEEFEEFRDDSLGYMSEEQVAQLSPEVFEMMDGEGFYNFDPDVFDDFEPEQIQRMPGEAFAGLTAVQFNQFGDDELGAMTEDQIRHLSPKIFSGMNGDKFAKLPPNTYDDLDEEDCENLPPSVFGNMDADKMSLLGEHCLMGMENEDFDLLPEDALGGLNNNNLAGLPPRVIKKFTPQKLQKLNPDALGKLRDERPFDMFEITANLDTSQADATTYMGLMDDYLPPGVSMNPETGEFEFTDDSDYGGEIPFPEFEIDENERFGDLASRIKFKPFVNLHKGFGLGGAGRPGVELLKEALALAGIPGFEFRQDEEGFVELFGTGELAGAEFDLVIEGVKKAPKGSKPGDFEIDPFTGVYRLTTDKGLQFEMAMGPPNVTCLAKGASDHEVNYTEENVMILKPKASGTTASGRRDSGSVPVAGRSSSKGKSRRAAQPGLAKFPATQPGERPYATLTYGNDIGIDDCAGFVQTITPTLPSPKAFVELLSSVFGSILSKDDLYSHVNGSIRLDFKADGVRQLFEIVPDFPTQATNIMRGKVEKPRLKQNPDGSFALDTLGRFLYITPYDGQLLTIPVALIPIME